MPASLRSSSVILTARVLLLLIAAGAAATGFVMSGRGAPGHDGAGTMYACPMHPQVRSPSPDERCLICRMALEREAPPIHAAAHATATASAAAAHREDIVLPPGAEIRPPHDVVRTRVRVGVRTIRAPAWVEDERIVAALLYRDEVNLLVPGEKAVFLPTAGTPGRTHRTVGVRPTADAPSPWDDATWLVRFRADGTVAKSSPQAGWIELAARTGKDIVVPYDAVVRSAAGPYVFLVGADNRTLTRRSVEIGSVVSGEAAVISGVGGNARIAAMNTFFLNAEGQRSKGTAP